ncbi:type IV pilus modification protein PilV [Allochromatium vinosum]|uniref:Type IV pilus modification protein PilV n=1 Tax=Allochromatium vinosum (strain ATCC 17899 / DSM 180 / NBRC 103801 / NCIMB 10441 / D) TaxID=572477 RepID=D3RRK5_ALLVD|nr:type IV pilus modification protein PilV [Allochromatium vinosum]ADC63917.1 type IV pilus modification protein PilV [Allochromatium vinosum DSM 180]
MANRRRPLGFRHSRGTSLIEAMVTAVVLAIGLLGIAALQGAGLRANNDAKFQTLASDVAWDLADRMRANVHDYADENTSPYVTSAATNCGSSPSKTCAMTPDDSPVDCSSADMAAFDLYQVSCVNGVDLLPSGTLSVTCTNTGARATPCRITVGWQGPNDTEAQQIVVDLIPGRPEDLVD